VAAAQAGKSGRTAGWPIALGPAVFAALTYLYVWLRIDTALIYHASWVTLSHPVAFPSFSVGLDFLKPFLGYPGGPVRYATAFLSQLYYYPWCGAAVFGALVWALSLTTATAIGAASGRRPRVLHFLPGVMLLVLLNRYLSPMAAALAALTGMAGVAVYIRWEPARPSARLAWFAAPGLAVYYLACSGFLLYALMCAVFELVGRRRLAAGLACLAGGVLIPLVLGHGALGLRLTDAYLLLSPYHRESDPHAAALSMLFWLSAPAGTLLAVLARAAPAGRVPAPKRVLASGSAARLAMWGAALTAVLVLGPTLHATKKTRFQIDFYSGHGMWEALLEAAESLPPEAYSLTVAWDVNRALYHTGRLTSSMFAFRQGPRSLMVSPAALSHMSIGRFPSKKLGDVLLDLGLVNEAEHTTYEALEFMGDDPRILRRLAIISAAKGETAAARVLLGALSRDLIHGRWARQCLRRLDADPLLPVAPEAGRLRAVMLLEDASSVEDTGRMLRSLLARDPQNRMAFEYLMAYQLLTANLGALARTAERLEQHGCERVPCHCEEALLIHAAGTGMRAEPGGLRISTASHESFCAFCEILATHRGDPAAARTAAAEALPGTYFPYYAAVAAGAMEK
jgi:hypothetical protein